MVFCEQIGSRWNQNVSFSMYVCGCPPVLGKIRSAVGSAQLLMSQKFQQFYWLCQQNLVSSMFLNKETLSAYIYSYFFVCVYLLFYIY